MNRVIVLANRSSGSSDGTVDPLIEALRRQGCEVQSWTCPPRELTALARRARDVRPQVVVACGGDGTVNTVANALAGSDVALGIVPQGTFNYVARLYDISEDPEEAAAVIAHGQTRMIPGGFINGRLFLNNFSFGLYTDIIQARERHKATWGRHRVVAVLSALATSLRSRARIPIHLSVDEREGVYRGRTSLFFAGVNPAQFESAGLELADPVREGALGIVLIHAVEPLGILKILATATVNQAERLQALDTFSAGTARVLVPRTRLRCVIDGELLSLRAPLQLEFRREALHLVAPAASRA